MPLRHIADVRTSSVDKHSHEGEVPVVLCNYTDVYRGDRLSPGEDLMRATATPDEVARFRLAVGDTVLTKDSEDPHDIGISAYVGETSDEFVCGYHLAIVRPAAGVHPRFLNWSLRGRPALSHFSGHASGISRYGLSQQGLRSAPVWLPPLDTQARIADFLDDRVDRIDRIMAARREQLSLASDVSWADFGAQLDATRAPSVPLRRAIRTLADGPFGSAFSSSDYVHDGPAVIRLGNIGFAEFKNHDLVRVPKAVFNRFSQSRVSAGDLLIASLGDARNHAGRACLAPNDLGEAMVKGKCFVARANASVSSESFMSVLLSSPRGADALVQLSTGATRSMLNFERLLSCRLPLPDLEQQAELVARFEQGRGRAHQAVAALTSSLDLLTEYKTSLITAAVTGEIDVTTAGSGVPG